MFNSQWCYLILKVLDKSSVITIDGLNFPFNSYKSLFYNNNIFNIDICITSKISNNKYLKLVYNKNDDSYIWNESIDYSKIRYKAKFIKYNGYWEDVRKQYIKIKNRYLELENNKYHRSFTCYIESVNNVYNAIKNMN